MNRTPLHATRQDQPADGGFMSENQTYVWGVDCGSSEIKVVCCDQTGRLLLKRKQKTLFPLYDHVFSALNGDSKASPFIEGGNSVKPNHRIIATGYGRNYLNFIDDKLTEIKAHFLGVQSQLQLNKAYTLIDIGGQDAKVIHAIDGRVDQFVINRKCAAGTGAYIEELAHRLEVPLSEMTQLAQAHDKELTLNSYCTVFSGQEVIKVLMTGERVENLIYALYRSVVKRVLEMTSITTDTVVFSGGVMNHHPMLVTLFAEKLNDKELIVAPETQFCGALGAAFFGLKEE